LGRWHGVYRQLTGALIHGVDDGLLVEEVFIRLCYLFVDSG
jgi:hypothetical protein